MSQGDKHLHAWMKVHADAVIHDYLADVCSRVEISGSLRRNKPEVGDVEIVCVPKPHPVDQVDLFSPKEAVDSKEIIERIESSWYLKYRSEKRGEKFLDLVDTHTNAKIDLFIVTPPATWGVIQTIRTGPAEYSKSLMERALSMGLRVKDGALYRKLNMKQIPTEEEIDFYNALELPWVSPENRM
jgi:DNA polymerase/3'-5' exonuclease PolX